MRLRFKILKSFIDIGILAIGLLLIYSNQIIAGDYIGWLSTDGIGVMLIVFGSYLGVIAFIELLLVYMRQDTWMAKTIKSFVAILLVITIFPFVLFGVLWMFGFGIEGDVVPVLMLIAVIRAIIGVWLGRLFNARSAAV